MLLLNKNWMHKKEKGLALFTGLIFLIAASAVTIAGMQGTGMQERMASNQHNKSLSLYATEIGAVAFVEQVSDPSFYDEYIKNIEENEIETLLDASTLETNSITIDNRNLDYSFSNFSYTPAVTGTTGPGSLGTLGITITGTVEAGGITVSESQLYVDWQLVPGTPFAFDPPAPITCCGPSCDIDLDTGGGNPNNPNVSGYDHEPPSNFNCSGNDCRQYSYADPTDSDNPYTPKPAIYFDQDGDFEAKKNINLWPPENDVYRNDDGPSEMCGGIDLAELDSIGYQNNMGVRGAPELTLMSSGSIQRGAGILMIDAGNVLIEDAADVTISGTSYYEGLVILRNCATLTASGTPHIFGAVVIMSQGCGPDYAPFLGNGRPAVMYSSTALEASKFSSGGSGGKTGSGNNRGVFSSWRELIDPSAPAQ